MINITPNAVGHCEQQHRMLEHLHSTPLPAVINVEIAPTTTDMSWVVCIVIMIIVIIFSFFIIFYFVMQQNDYEQTE